MAFKPRSHLLARLNHLATRLEQSPIESESSRRKFLEKAALGAGTLAAASVLGPWRMAFAAPRISSASVAVVGGGLAGLVASHELKNAGANVSLYEASNRMGGRCWSLRGMFPGQVAERGGELIDTTHRTMLSYATEFGLNKERMDVAQGEIFYYFDGVLHAEEDVTEDYRDFVSAMRSDLQALSGEVSALSHTADDIRIDRINLKDYLAGNNGARRAASPLLQKVMGLVYNIEYGREPEFQSAINFLHFIHADKRSKFTPFGIYSDEKYHLTDGNDAIATNLANRVSNQSRLGLRLVKIKKTPQGRFELTFKQGATTVVQTHDLVVLTLPFSVLRESVELDPSLGMSPQKINAIQTMGYGMNAKHMLAMKSPFWFEIGASGTTYSDLAHHQAAWETNPSRATTSRAILTDYSSGARAIALNPRQPGAEAERFINALEQMYPGASSQVVRKSNGQILSHLEHWPSNPNTLGSYTCYLPGQFTSVAGLEAQPVGNLHFAGEHTDSFYSWQGFMEGACLSGLRAAAEVLAKLR